MSEVLPQGVELKYENGRLSDDTLVVRGGSQLVRDFSKG